VCDDYINANYFKVVFKDCVLYGIHFVENMPEADMKNKVIKAVYAHHTTLHSLKLCFKIVEKVSGRFVVWLWVSLHILQCCHEICNV